MTSTKPYLIRAIREWAMDNGFTPEILVNAGIEQVVVPLDFVRDGQIVLNVHERAIDAEDFNNEAVCFTARFQGSAMDVYIPTEAVMAIYARENRLGIFFQNEPEPDGDDSEPKEQIGPRLTVTESSERADSGDRKKPDLKIVK